MPRSTSTPRPAHHANNAGTLFRNPWPSAEKPTWTELLQSPNPLSWYSSHALHKHDRARKLDVVKPDWGVSSLQKSGLEKEKCVTGTWLGHAGVMVELPIQGTRNAVVDGGPASAAIVSHGKESLWVLFDPIFSFRAGPTQYTGPSRMKSSPCTANDLPMCDAIVISHNHYDHLDLSSLKTISKKFPKCKYFVPLGNKSWLSGTGIAKELIYELDWWGDLDLPASDFDFKLAEDVKEVSRLKFTCVPAQHNSGRGTLDQGKTLWCGWVIEQFLDSPGNDSNNMEKRRKGAIYFAGDTGYRRTSKSEEVCPAFKEIGDRLGPFDLSFVPIWRGGSLGFVSSLGLRLSPNHVPTALHATPADAIAIHKDVQSKNSVAVHFGTFIGAEEEAYDAIVEFDEAREKQGVNSIDSTTQGELGRAGTLDIGGSISIEIQ
ncbi:NAPE-hydrolyzing phospholipase D [Phlyctema vagabunda]|uniref:NAPE-hydrolyzing phospholipase D n=1 Tax=Phlyctema vagabunda TaxID=108571 RepID=A0ABR4PLD3_9HELO